MPICGGGGVCAEEYYLIIIDQKNAELDKTLADRGFKELYDYCYYHCDMQQDGDARCVNGLYIGKGSFYSPPVRLWMDFVYKIGRYTSVNPLAAFHINHPLNMVSAGARNGILKYLSDEDMLKFLGRDFMDCDRRGTGMKVTVGNDVTIGAFAFINASTVAEIGDGAMVGAHAVVTRDVPPYSIVYGNPARIHGYRYSPEEIEILLAVKWWDWDDEEIRKNAELLIYPDLFFERYRRL